MFALSVSFICKPQETIFGIWEIHNLRSVAVP